MRRITQHLLSIWIVTMLLMGCQPAHVAPSAETTPLDRFTERVMGEDGLGYELSGPTHVPLSTARVTYELQLRNESDAPWEGRYCLLLVDNEQVVEMPAQETFALAAHGVDERVLHVERPAVLDAGRYGLIFVVERPSGDTVSISYLDVGAEDPTRPPRLAVIPEEVVETARARCIPAIGDVPPGAAAEDVVRVTEESRETQ